VASGKRVLYTIVLLTAILVIIASAIYITDRQESNGNENPVFEVYGFCFPIGNTSFECIGSMVNQGPSIVPIDNITLGIGSYSGKIELNPSLVLKEYSSVNFEFILYSNGRYMLFSSDGVSRMTWKGVIPQPPSIRVDPVLVFNETHRAYRSSGLIPIEINDYQFVSNESVSYFGLLYFESNHNVSYVDVKLMILHDQLAWEDVMTNVGKEFFVIPFQTAIYPVGESNLIGYPSRVTVSYESLNEVNVTVRLEVYKTQSAVVSFDVGLSSLNDILPILPPHFSDSLFNHSPYFLYSCPIPQTLSNPTK